MAVPSGRFSVEKAKAKDCNKYLISNLQSTWQAEKVNSVYSAARRNKLLEVK